MTLLISNKIQALPIINSHRVANEPVLSPMPVAFTALKDSIPTSSGNTIDSPSLRLGKRKFTEEQTTTDTADKTEDLQSQQKKKRGEEATSSTDSTQTVSGSPTRHIPKAIREIYKLPDTPPPPVKVRETRKVKETTKVKKTRQRRQSKSEGAEKTTRINWPYESNETASTQAAGFQLDLESVRNHAYLRIQLFIVTALALHNISSFSAKAKAKILGATAQGGTGSFGRHAAHAHTASGLTDNMRDLIQEDIALHGITEKTEFMLRAKGFTGEMLEGLNQLYLMGEKDPELKQNVPAIIAKIFHKTWRLRKQYRHSVLEQTNTEKTVNATTELAPQLNLQCDGLLEKAIRPALLPQLYQSLMLGAIDPEAAGKEYVDMIRVYFLKVIPEFQQKITELEQYSKLIISYIENSPSLKKKDRKAALRTLDMWLELITISDLIPKIHLDKCRLYIKNSLRECAGKSNKKKTPKDLSVMNEVSRTIKKLQLLLEYHELELSGTKEPPFLMLAGKYNPLKKTHEPLTTPERRRQQARLLRRDDLPSPVQPETPFKKPSSLDPKTPRKVGGVARARFSADKENRPPIDLNTTSKALPFQTPARPLESSSQTKRVREPRKLDFDLLDFEETETVSSASDDKVALVEEQEHNLKSDGNQENTPVFHLPRKTKTRSSTFLTPLKPSNLLNQKPQTFAPRQLDFDPFGDTLLDKASHRVGVTKQSTVQEKSGEGKENEAVINMPRKINPRQRKPHSLGTPDFSNGRQARGASKRLDFALKLE